MAQLRDTTRLFLNWALEFTLGDYRGPPVDYVMALAAVAAMFLVTLVSGIT